MTTTAEIAWLAGLIEGEGNIRLTGAKASCPVVTIEMTDRDVIERAAALLGSAAISERQRGSNKTIYTCRASSSAAAGWLMTLYPFMGRRRQERIRECLRSWRAAPLRPSKRTHCPQGHPYDAANTYVAVRTGRRYCHTCRDARDEARSPRRPTPADQRML